MLSLQTIGPVSLKWLQATSEKGGQDGVGSAAGNGAIDKGAKRRFDVGDETTGLRVLFVKPPRCGLDRVTPIQNCCALSSRLSPGNA
jgi:hypothetical protein